MARKAIRIESTGDGNELSILQEGDGKIVIHRYSHRGKVNNYVENYEHIDESSESRILPLTAGIAHLILNRAMSGVKHSECFVFYDRDPESCYSSTEKSEQEHRYTSTGIKFWRHQKQMMEFKTGGCNTVITTHVSPEGACNLSCPYCSVTYRDTHSRIDLDVIKSYILDLKTRGLKAVILTGGGEPTAYPHFSELVNWIKYDQQLSVGLITNGTLFSRINKSALRAFSWIRVSINLFDGWEDKIGSNLDLSSLSEECIVGCSMVYTAGHEAGEEMAGDRVGVLEKVSTLADKIGAKYIRLLPNCLLGQRHLIAQHKALDKTLERISDDRFFHQYKVHGVPNADVCHQSYFRPYLSEEPYGDTGVPGTVYPCDSLVLNRAYQYFEKSYALCSPEDILDYIDGKIEPKFNPRFACSGCVFTENVDMLEDWKNGKINLFDKYDDPMDHEEFV